MNEEKIMIDEVKIMKRGSAKRDSHGDIHNNRSKETLVAGSGQKRYS